MRDWKSWHEQYEDPDSSLSRRLEVVRQSLRDSLSGSSRPGRLLSLCSGDGRDVIPVLAELPADRRPAVVLVELDPELAAGARERAAASKVEATVIVGDAGALETWREHVPVDLLVLCGIFGNVPDADIEQVIRTAPFLLAPHGRVIWTRGYRDEDLRPQIRTWFAEAGFSELAYDEEPTGFGVGMHALSVAPRDGRLPQRLFSFSA